MIYIAGTSHSGSTLLDLMLNAHPEIISVGEVLKLNRQIKLKKNGTMKVARCSCGASPALQCEFWSRVEAKVREDGCSLAELDLVNYSTIEPDRAPNAILFRAIAHVSQKRLIVDSSKIPHRLAHLLKLPEVDVYPIHLVRDPKGQISSVLDKSSLLRGILSYEIVHMQLHRLLRTRPHSVVCYEDLVREPEGTLNTILKPFDLKFHPRQLAWAEQVKHSVAGNHLRWETSSHLNLDERWKSRLSHWQQFTIACGTFASHSLTGKT